MNASAGTVGRVVWVTGASGGLGQALVDAFLAAGWRVAGAYGRNPVTRPSKDWLGRALDVRDAQEVERVRDAIVAAWGGIDVLVNNAGVAEDALLGRMEEEAWDRVLAVDLKGAFLCARAVLPLMTRRGEGHLIHVSSWAGRAGAAGQANYAAAKAGLLGLSAALAREGGPRNVRSNVVLPGVLPTGMTAELTADQTRKLREANQLGRLNECAEVAEFIVHLAGMRNVSGQLFQLDSRIGRWT